MYHVLLALGLALVYLALAKGYAWFFEGRVARLSPTVAGSSIVVVIAVALIADAVSLGVGDWQLANRVLHIFAGGFATTLAAALAARDTGLAVGRLRFAIATVLVVTTLGVANELVEFALQHYGHLRFSAGPLDTWFDLASNTIGVAIGLALLTPLVALRGARAHHARP